MQVQVCVTVFLAAADRLKPQKNTLAAISQRHSVAPIVDLGATFLRQLISSWAVDDVAAAIDTTEADALMEAFNAFLKAAVADNDMNLTNAILLCLADTYECVVCCCPYLSLLSNLSADCFERWKSRQDATPWWMSLPLLSSFTPV
jgi:hypothetical protein